MALILIITGLTGLTGIPVRVVGIPATRKTLKHTTQSRPISVIVGYRVPDTRRVAGQDGNYPLPATHFATPK